MKKYSTIIIGAYNKNSWNCGRPA